MKRLIIIMFLMGINNSNYPMSGDIKMSPDDDKYIAECIATCKNQGEKAYIFGGPNICICCPEQDWDYHCKEIK
jgi:hypothetical protein